MQSVGVLLAPAQVFFQLGQNPLLGKQKPLGMLHFLNKIGPLAESVRGVPGRFGVWPGALGFLYTCQQLRG